MAISATTLTELLLDVGTLVIGSTDIGATGPEGSFAVEQEIYWPELGGARGNIAGTGKVVTESATLQLTVKEISVAGLARALPTVASSSDATSEYTTAITFGMIGTSVHQTVTWTGSQIDGKAIKIILSQALPEGGLTMNLNDKGESEYELTFRSYYAAATPTTRAWQVYTQK
jgi:hypothetical protein